ncbi:MAG: polysaccharide pyruvyl transferase CsaB [Oscillospiraceae bacterium]|nr:polysaccharide pyruvyl transferase CsaB [Oscillospiraceae bacterium]
MKESLRKKKSARQGVVISGAYGLENAGDDDTLRSILSALHRIDKSLSVTVIAHHPKRTARRFHVTARGLWNVPGWLLAMRQASLFISGGGSLLQDVTSRRSLWFYLLTIRMAKKMGCAVELYGCGIGPIRQEKARQRTADCLNQCADVISVRDQDSLDTLTAWGVTRPRLLLGADPSLCFTPKMQPLQRQIGFVLRPWPGFWVHVPDFAQAARYARQQYNLTPVFYIFAPEDKAAVESVMAELEDRSGEILPMEEPRDEVPCGVRQASRRFERMTVMLSIRLHGLIFALRAGVPAAGVSYDPKVDAFCREAGLPSLSLEDVTGDGLCRLIDQAMDLDGETLSRSLSQLRERELRNSRAAAQLLAGEKAKEGE